MFKARLFFASRRLSVVQFDVVVRALRRELEEGTIEKIGKQARWARNYFRPYFFHGGSRRV